jgi:hypothetical protein
VAVGGILSVWFTGLATTQTAGIENKTGGVIKCVGGLLIEEVKVPSSTSTVLNVTYTNNAQYSVSGIYVEIVNASVVASEAGDTSSLTPGAMGVHTMSISTGIPITRVRVRGSCEGQTISDDCEPGDACWKTA